MNQSPDASPAPVPQKVALPPSQPASGTGHSRLFYFGLAGVLVGGICCILSVLILILSGVLGRTPPRPSGGSPAIPLTGTALLASSLSLPPGSGTQVGNGLAGLLEVVAVVAGLIGALLMAAGVVALVLDYRNQGSHPPSKPIVSTPTSPEPPQIRYSLRVSATLLELHAREHVPVYFQALRIPPMGGPVIAPEAMIKVIVPETPGRLAASPVSAMGSLECDFSAPEPQVCESLTVLAIAMVGEQVKARAYLHVHILPLYELEMKWEDPQQPALQMGGKEVLVWARVNTIPPDPDSYPDVLAKLIDVRVEGPNSDWIRHPLKPYLQFERQWIPIAVVRPAAGAELLPGNPDLVANFTASHQSVVARLPVELDHAGIPGPG